jgi:photosystem II stability/assembly factor-like uncharacterized protein
MIAGATFAQAQWTMQQANSTASLRGIHNVGSGVVWASGADGTVLHTTNDGQTWRTCAVPPEAEKLDFRGIQAFDASIAIVMSSGAGGLSRLYKTTDACRTWRLVLSNPDESGFWDAIQFTSPSFGVLIGDQVRGHFPVFFSTDGGDTWQQFDSKPTAALDKNQSFFAASNTALLIDPSNTRFYMITGGGKTSLITVNLHFTAGAICKDCLDLSYAHPELAAGETAGGFSLASRVDGANPIMVAVGGDYKAPDKTIGTAAFWIDDRRPNARWHASETPPHGYRSGVAYYASSKTWITVGPNGTDVSTDDGRNWRALKPAAGEIPDADKNWNALSLPFAVGSKGRIGKLSSR